MSFIDSIKSQAGNLKREEEVITLEEYLSLVKEDKSLSRKSHQYVLDMIMSHGEEEVDGLNRYKFFEEQLFGIEESIDKIMNYLKAAATGSEVSRRILLLFGPTSSGKSQLAVMLKEDLKIMQKQKRENFFA